MHLHTHSEVVITRHVKVTGHRSPYDGDWVYWSSRRGRHSTVNTRLAKLLQRQRGRCAYCGLFFQQEDRLEMDHISGDRQDRAMPIFKPFMDTAMMRKPGNMGSISRSVCVTSCGALRSGVHGNGHVPLCVQRRRTRSAGASPAKVKARAL